MNKKLFLGMFAAAGMLLATSCSNDELDMAQSGNEAQVTFSLGLEGGIATRAISDGLSAKKLVCAVYDANETLLDKVVINNKQLNQYGQFETDEAFQGGLTDQINVTLAKGQEYTMVFWAQNKDCGAYDTQDLKAVKVDYTNGEEGETATGDINNDDTRDAFYAAETFKVEGNKEINVTLKRPFAQINVGVEQTDWDAAVASGIEIKKSAVVIKNAANQINLLTGAVSGNETVVTYASHDIPNETLYVETDKDKEGKEAYKWLSMSYILVADEDTNVDENGLLGTDRTTLQGLQYTFSPESGKGNDIKFAEGLAGAPVQRNWRTNILGKILTGDIQFNITIEPAYDGDIIYPSKLEEELKFAAAFGGTVSLYEDITLKEPLNVNADMILNLNGKTITTELEKEGRHHYAINNNATLILEGTGAINARGVQNFGTMTVNGNITITNIDTNGGAAIWNEGTLTVNDGTFTTTADAGAGSYGAALNTRANAKTTVNGGKFIGNSQLTYAIINYGGETVINDAEVEGKHGAVATELKSSKTSIYGGTFKQTDNPSVSDHCIYTDNASTTTLYGGTYSVETLEEKNGGQVFYGDNTKVADGYAAVENGDTWSVFKSVANVADLKTALAEGGVVALSADVTLSDVITLDKETTIYLNGNKLDASSNTSRPFTLSDGASLTIEATGAEIKCGTYGLVNMTEGTLTINGGSFENTQGNNGAFIKVSGEEKMVINLNNVNYKAGTTDSGVLRTSGPNVTVNVNGGEYEAGYGILLENGSINNAKITATNTANMWPAVYADGNITVTGCTIKAACHAVAVGGGNTLSVNNCNVTAADEKLAFQVFSSGGTINVTNSTYTGGYGTTSKISSGSPDAVINIDGKEVYRKSAQ